MPRRLYPTHTGRFGGLNRQLMYARGRLNRFSDRATGYPQMPQGVAGEEFHPEEYKTSPMWDDVEQRLHDILRNPPKYHRDPQSDEDKLERDQYLLATNPAVMIGRERNEALLEAAKGKGADAEEKQYVRAYDHAVKTHEKAIDRFNKAFEKNKAKPGTYSKPYMKGMLYTVNSTARAVHQAGGPLKLANLEETFPELGETGMPLSMELEEKRVKAERIVRSREGDVLGSRAMGEHGLPDPFSVGGGDPEQIEALNVYGAAMDKALKEKRITQEQWDEMKDAITAEPTGKKRVAKSKEILTGTPVMPVLEEYYREQQTQAAPPAQLPQSFSGVGEDMTGEDVTGQVTPTSLSPGGQLPGEGQEATGLPLHMQQMGGQLEGPENYMDVPQNLLNRMTDDRFWDKSPNALGESWLQRRKKLKRTGRGGVKEE